jgi:hypothetical protein
MLSIADGGSLSCALNSPIDPRLKRLLRQRREQLGSEYPLEELANFSIIEAGDTPADVEQTIGFSVFHNPVDGSRFGEHDWTPGWEWIDDHGFAYELCFILDDSGFGHVVIIPKQKGVAPELIRLCETFASAPAS